MRNQRALRARGEPGAQSGVELGGGDLPLGALVGRGQRASGAGSWVRRG